MKEIKSLRLLITSRCPYKCFYCHKEGMKFSVPELLTASDYKYFVGLLKDNFRLEKVTLTGGDPFCRRDIWDISKSIKESKVFLIIITKGMLIKKIGIVDQINFTIDTLDRNKYTKITGVDKKLLQKTICKLIKAKSMGIKVVINTPLSKNINDDKESFEKLLFFCKKYKIDEWKLIEEMSVDKNNQETFYLEEYANRMGIIKQFRRIRNYKLSLNHRGVFITLYRCHCNAIKLLNKYISESLFFDPAGNILLCMQNNKKINLLDFIKKRDDNSIIKTIDNIDFKKICPILKLK